MEEEIGRKGCGRVRPGAPVLVLFLAALTSTSCGTPSQVRFETDGLHYESGPLAVRFKDPAYFRFIDGSWRIDNWALNYSHKLIRRNGVGFKGNMHIDLTGDGRAENCPGYFTDIELRNVETEGLIWAFMRELPQYRRQVNLDVLLDNYADNLTFEGYTRTGPFDIWDVEIRSFAARIISREAVKFGPFDAVMATIEIANLAQLKLDPQSRMGFVRVLIARIPDFQTNVVPEGGGWFPHSNTGVLTVGYYESVAYFEKGLPDFEAFLGQFTVYGKPIAITREKAAAPAAIAPAEEPKPEPIEAPLAEPAPVRTPVTTTPP